MSKKSCIKVCKKCGKEFVAQSGYVRYCNDCAEEVKKENLHKNQLKQRKKKLDKLVKNGIEGYDYIIDMWSGEPTTRIGDRWFHIKYPNKTMDDYKREFPNSPLVCKKLIEKISENSKKYMNRPEIKKFYSEKIKGDKNPNAKCNTTEEQRKSVSPFSKSFKGYQCMSDDEKVANIKSCLKLDKVGRTTNQIEYWINKGYTEEEAKQKVSDRQRTFTLDKCIEKYGQEKGVEVWKERQYKWVHSLQQSFEKDGDSRTPISKFESDCKKRICEILHIDIPHKQKYISDKNNNHYSYDLTINNKIIEFNGDYWHCNPNLYCEDYFNKSKQKTAHEIWEYDKIKINCAKSFGYDVLVIWESEYNKDKEGTIQKCIDFLTQNNI